MAHKIKFGNGVWANQKGSSLAYNDENNNYKPLPFKVTRASIGTRVNKQGLVKVVGHDQLRIDYTDSDNGVALLEPASTNKITYSENINHSSWVKTGTGTASAPSITSNYSISPDGTQNADRVIFNLNGGTANGDISQVSVTIGSVSSATYTNSVYIKSNTANNYDIVVTDPSGGYVVKTITPQWQRFDNTRTSVTNLSIRIRLRGDEGTSDFADVSIWGVQVEEQLYATSYIPTSGSAVTRQGDLVNGSGNSKVINDSEGVLFANISALADDFANYRFISLYDGTYNNFCDIYYGDASNRISVRFRSGGGSVINMFSAVSDVKLFSKVAISWKLNEFKFFINGVRVGLNTSGASPTGLNKLDFNQVSNSNPFYGNTKELGYYDAVLTDSELEYLTSYRTWESMVNEMNLNIIYNG